MDQPDSTKKTATRKGSTPISVRALPEEKALIDQTAKRLGLSTAAYLRTLGMDYEPKSRIVPSQVDELSRLNQDLARLGRLLKAWLANDPRTTQLRDATIRALLSKIEDTQDQMRETVKTVVRSPSER